LLNIYLYVHLCLLWYLLFYLIWHRFLNGLLKLKSA